MADRNSSVRDAGNLIAQSGLVDDVISTNGADPSQRSRGRDADAEAREDDYDNDADSREVEDEDDDADADNSNQRDEGEEADDEAGEPEDDGEADEGQQDDEDGDEPATDNEPEYEVKVNGKTSKVKVSELVAGYQRGKDYQQKTARLAATAREFQAGHSKVAEDYVRKLRTLQGVNEGLVKLLSGDLNSDAMKQLRDTDYTQYQRVRETYQEKIDRIQQVIQGLTTEQERHLDSFKEARNADTARLVGHEKEKLLAAIPDWNGKDGKPGVGAKVMKFLGGLGFAPEELHQVYDARMLVVADLARRWVESNQRRTQPVKQKQKQPPKIVRPGATSIQKAGGQQTQKQTSFRKARDIARKSGNMRDAGKAIQHLL